MNLTEFAWHLSDLLEHSKVAYLRTEPEVPDFTSTDPVKILISGKKKVVEYEVKPTLESVRSVLGILDVTIFDSKNINMLFCWNLKSLMSYFRFFIPKVVNPTVSLIDLQPIENFLNIKKKQPKTVVEALNRGQIISKQPAWKTLYKKIHLPLTLRTLPAIETTPLLSTLARGPVYAYYEIEGQVNGRMNNYKKFDKSYLPFTMGNETKRDLKPRGENVRFLTADFRGCEVAVLHWLTKDKGLEEILLNKDIHKAIYEKLTGDSCDTENKRSMSKRMFLPVMYGLGPNGLSKNLNLNPSVAKELISRIRKFFPLAWDWMWEKQNMASKGMITDHFGRPRTFPEDKSYLARNFSVQGVAATVCMEKLILLQDKLNPDEIGYVCFNVHDGYGLVCHTKAAKQAYETVKHLLTSESSMCEGLRMNAEIKFGVHLDEMKVFWK